MLKTPGVYVYEESTLPPSVAEVPTAIPAFIGYTALGSESEVEVAQVSTLLEYERRFGPPKPTDFEADASGNLDLAKHSAYPKWPLWYALKLYFANGGGRCYVVSVGSYAKEDASVKKERLEAGIDELENSDEPSLIVIPELAALAKEDFGSVCEKALGHCGKMRARFAILDVMMSKSGDPITESRAAYKTESLAYGAAYYPTLLTTLVHAHADDHVKVAVELETDTGTGSQPGTEVPPGSSARVQRAEGTGTSTLAQLKSTRTALYNRIKQNLAQAWVELPPSAAVAGVYARVDRARGVWKAPANVGLLSVIGPTKQITHEQQASLNIDDTSGKSINALRTFTGKGTLVWGARTLAGNDNEWRYVSVRRLFIMVEESARKASQFAVFEPNTPTTWLKVKGMIESYLYALWEKGALQGRQVDQAYFVNVGVPDTMTDQDVLDGIMTVHIGIAAVRPAEFIELTFSHKLASS
jgi:phage tail sheath protein FI